MGVSKADTELVDNYFKFLQRNQLENAKCALELLKSSSKFSNVNPVNVVKLVKSGDTSLHICARNGYLDLLKYLVEVENANLELINLDGKTALHDAAQFSHLEVVEYLLSKGSNVNVVKKADWTPLMLACTKSNFLIVQALVIAGAKLKFVNKDGWTCIHIAAREGNVDILSFLLNSCGGDGDTTTKSLLKEMKSRNGRRAIHTAVLHGHLDAVRLLAEESSLTELNAEDNCGASPLLDACRCGLIDVVNYFVKDLKLDPNVLNKNGVGLLHVAAEANQADMIEFLVSEFQLDVNKPSRLLLFTPLHWASREGNLPAVKTLVKLGANAKIKDIKGKTAINIAKEFAKEELCQFYDGCI